MNKKILIGLCALFMLPSIQGNTNTNNSYKENITPDRSKVPAFPGADGAGKYTTGGKLRTKETPRYTQIGNAIPPLFGEQAGCILDKIINNRPPYNRFRSQRHH